MPAKGSDDRSESASDGLIEQLQSWALRNLRPLVVVIGIVSMLFFVAWLITTLVWPAVDTQRKRVEISLANDRVLGLDYPRRFLADNQALPVYLTADSTQPVTVTLRIPGTLSLILESVEPSNSVNVVASSGEFITLTWPVTSTAQLATSGLALPVVIPRQSGIPFVGDPKTVTLNFKNALTERGWKPFEGINEGWFQIVEAERQGYQFVGIETTTRASWRAFAQTYSFLVVLPFLITAFGYLGKTYTDRQKSQRKDAKKALDEFKLAISVADGKTAATMMKTIEGFAKYLSPDDLERARQLNGLATGVFAPEIEANDFCIWPDAWVGALQLSYANDTLDKQAIYRYIRSIPIDQLSVSAEKRFRGFTQQLRLIPTQSHDWPLPAEMPPSFSKYPNEEESAAKKPLTVSRIALFSKNSADDLMERRFLFSENAQTFWRGHPLYEEIRKKGNPVLVPGKRGVGRTALALALTQFADRKTERVLGSFHSGPASLVDVQQSLTHELLRFVRWRSAWLAQLEREDMDLLAGLLLTVLDTGYLLAQLSVPQREEVAGVGNGSLLSKSTHAEQSAPHVAELANGISDTKVTSGSEQAVLELRLLRQSVERVASKRKVSIEQWFLGLSLCAQRLSFERLRVALDMTALDWTDWRNEYLPSFRRVCRGDCSVPIQFVLMVAGEADLISVEASDIEMRELTWGNGGANGQDILSFLLQHRAQRCINADLVPLHLPALGELSSAAQGNPQRLADLWQRITVRYPSAEEVTIEMVDATQKEMA